MGIKDILVHLDNSEASTVRLELAISYAIKHSANLRGLYLITHNYYKPQLIGEKADSETAEQIFKEKTATAGIAAEWVFHDCTVVGSSVSDLIVSYAYYTDLIILGQEDPASPNSNIPADLVERVTLMCGRPVLVAPYAGSFKNAGSRVMVAWKAGRESVRALNDALPFLEKTPNITITEIQTTETNEYNSLENVQRFLAKHAIKSSTEIINSGSFPIGDMLLNNVCEKQIDLLIMGALAPGRRGSLELSVVARHILKHLTVPLLLSH